MCLGAENLRSEGLGAPRISDLRFSGPKNLRSEILGGPNISDFGFWGPPKKYQIYDFLRPPPTKNISDLRFWTPQKISDLRSAICAPCSSPDASAVVDWSLAAEKPSLPPALPELLRHSAWQHGWLAFFVELKQLYSNSNYCKLRNLQ